MTKAPPATGPEAILAALQAMDLDALEEEQRQVIKSGKVTKRGRAVRLLNVIQGLRTNQLKPAQLMISSVPVIPPKFRPFSLTGSTFLPGDANEVYRDLLEYRRLYRDTEGLMGREGASEAYMDLVRATKAAYGYGDSPNPKTRARQVKGFFKMVTGSSPKTSFYQIKMLSKPVDTVGRGVIVPDADLGMDEVGIPEEMAWKLYGNYVQRRLVLGGMSPADALRHLTDRTAMAKRALDDEMDVETDKDGSVVPRRPVIITRSPAWHRTNVIGQRARIVPGDAIRINTFITEGQNADFDGDECINQVFACACQSDLVKCGMSAEQIRNHKVKTAINQAIPVVLDDMDVYLFDLEDFPRGALIATKEGEKGRIDFHEVPGDIRVLAFDEKTSSPVWARVSNWSKHYDREIEIVDTHNGYQLVTDDDPRAVYGVAAGGTTFARFTPTEAVQYRVMVPRARTLPAVEATVTHVAGITEQKEGKRFSAKFRPMVDEIELDEEVGWFFGAAAGDGWVRKDKNGIFGVAIADAEDFNHTRFSHIVRTRLLGRDAPVFEAERDETRADHFGDTSISYRISSEPLGRWLQPLIGGERDETTAGSGNKHLPPFYLSVSRECRDGILGGLMDTDGSVSVSNAKGKPQLMVSFGSTSIRLVIETKLLAASLGISGRITPTVTPKGKPAWMLSLCNYEFKAWGGVGMRHERKLEILRSVEPDDACDSAVASDLVPAPLEVVALLRPYVGTPRVDRGADEETQALQREAQSLSVSMGRTLRTDGDTFGYCSRSMALRIIEIAERRLEERREIVARAVGLLSTGEIQVDQETSDLLRAAVLAAAPKYEDRNTYDEGGRKSPIIAQALRSGVMGVRRSENLRQWLLAHQVPESLDTVVPGLAAWRNILRADAVTWERVTDVQKTGIRETGYDLTVPGYETFMAADGIVLSNTMSVHVPSSPAAVKDVREKMMASKMLWSIKDRSKTMANPKHEQILGLSMYRPEGQAPKRHTFATEEEAENAIANGSVDLYDEIDIGRS